MIRFGVIYETLKQWLIPTKIIRHNILHVYVTLEDTILVKSGKKIDSNHYDFKVLRKLRKEIILVKKLRFFKKVCFEKKGFLTYKEIPRYKVLALYKESLKKNNVYPTFEGCLVKFTLQGRSFGEGMCYENEDECRAA
ncbi:hypothetical protein CL684_02485 [Candidatus Campbellbacteria bacterium]|nr:hypothetical protein [Candidatus Campbellbacteria bacterium]|tara:strand:+ start:138 stop:551 length:414 start_codon:yes stop_codon:yes gene_type:complete